MDSNLQSQYNNLYKAYKDMESSKLVLAEKSISEVLRQVAQNDDIYNLIAEMVLGFNYEKELNSAIINGEFILPSQKEKIIPLVFCILNEIDNGKISAISFITKTFAGENEEGYLKFCNNIVKPFVFSIKEMLGTEDCLQEENDPTSDFVEQLFSSGLPDRMQFLTDDILGKLSALKKGDVNLKNAVTTICYSVGMCLSNGEVLGLFGLFLGLKIALAGLKKFKNEIKEIDLLLKQLNEMN